MNTVDNLFSGKLIPKDEMRTRIAEFLATQALLEPPLVEALFGLLAEHDGSNVLVLEGDLEIAGDWAVDRHQKWVRANGVATVFCSGSVHVTGDLLCRDSDFLPMIFVAGNLRARNVIKGAPALFVMQDLQVDGFYLAEFDDGPLRVGGDLKATGYVLAKRAVQGVQNHVVRGRIEAQTLDLTDARHGGREIRAAFVPEVISEGWFDSVKIVERHQAGLPVWRNPAEPADLPEPPATEELPEPEISPVDCNPLGQGCSAREALERIKNLIGNAARLDPATFSYPEMYENPVRVLLEEYPDRQVLWLPAGTNVSGDLELDWDKDWIRSARLVGVVCEGDLTIEGDLLNRNLDGGPFLLVAGDLQVRNVIKGGAPVVVLGNVAASGAIVGEYNHGVIRIRGNVDAVALITLDHDCHVQGEKSGLVLNSEVDDFVDVLAPGLFEEGEEWPNAERIWRRSRAGLPLEP